MRKFFTIVIFALSINANAQIPTNGLIGWYPFSGNTNDLSGLANNGTISGGVTLTTDRFGNPNSAYHFNGTNGYITTINGGPLGQSSRTFSFWMKSSSTTKQMVLVYGNANGNGGCFDIALNNPCSGIGVDVSNGVVMRGNNAILDNQWHHCVIVLDSSAGTTISNIKVFINGNFQPSITCSALNSGANINTVNLNPYIIGKDFSSSRYFNGDIDDIRIYNRALTQNEITALLNESICFQTVTVTDTLIINANLTGFNPISYQNSIKIYPNPTNDHITIDFGSNYSTMNGYSLKITNSLSQVVYTTSINSQSTTVDLSNWTGNGIYFVHLIDAQSNTIDIRKIVLQ